MFEKITEEVRYLSPLKNFEEDLQDIEYRKDHLTGKWSRVNIQRSKRIKQSEGTYDYEELVKKSKEKCFFCPENLDKSTPRFNPDLIPRGFINRGETRVFPNLFPFARHHAVATVTEKHFLTTGEFEKEQIEDTLSASLEFCRAVYSKDEMAKYITFNWNHLFPAGASIIHPHVQITLDSRPTYMTEIIINASKEHFNRTRRCYWDDLIREEKRIGERYIGASKGITYLTSYSPFGNNEVLIIFKDNSSFTELEEGDVSNLSSGIVNILKGYAAMGVESYNLTTYSGPIAGDLDGFNLHMRFVSRAPPRPYYTSDIGFMEGLHFERVVESLPEDVALTMRNFF
jgi:galactose-1-phosphate uridylyltransferase